MTYRIVDRTGSMGHPFLASLCAGPIFVTILVGTSALGEQRWDQSLALILILPVASVFGFVIAVIPNLLGTLALHRVARSNEAVRLPVVWALLGGLMAGGGAAVGSASAEEIALFAATGVASALLCRKGADWPD